MLHIHLADIHGLAGRVSVPLNYRTVVYGREARMWKSGRTFDKQKQKKKYCKNIKV